SPCSGCKMPPASFSNSVMPEVFSPMTPIIAPPGATALKPARGAAYTFRNSMDTRFQDTSAGVIGTGVPLDPVLRERDPGAGGNATRFHLVPRNLVVTNHVSPCLLEASHAAAKIDSRFKHLRFVLFVYAAEAGRVLIALRLVQVVEHVPDDTVTAAHQEQAAELGSVDIVAGDFDVLRAHVGISIIHHDPEVAERVFFGRAAVDATVVTDGAVVEPVEIDALAVHLFEPVA